MVSKPSNHERVRHLLADGKALGVKGLHPRMKEETLRRRIVEFGKTQVRV